MVPSMRITDVDAFIEVVSDMQSGKEFAPEFSSKYFEVPQWIFGPLPGYRAPDNFPDCCEYHRGILQSGIDKLQLFPNCCDLHKRLLTTDWFNKSNYNYLPNKLVSSLSYTWHCIEESHEHVNWFKEITDYIEETMRSYGQFPTGYGSPLGLSMYIDNLDHAIKSEKNLTDEKKNLLLEFILKIKNPPTKIETTDLNMLIGKYKEWLKIFPFELSLFGHLKPYFENLIPVLKGPGETNLYSGLTAFKLASKKELIRFLTDLTESILQEINTLKLFNERRLQNAQGLQLEMILAKRKLELTQLAKIQPKDTSQYVKTLKTWLKTEKEFLKEIIPFIREKDPWPFIMDLVNGIKDLQKNDSNEPCIMTVRNNKPNKETSFRYALKKYFSARYRNANVTAEEEKGRGRIDLKITDPTFSDKIIEFKGWWNDDKKEMVEQICSYLTDFEREGYLFMINHCKGKDITEEYKVHVLNSNAKIKENSWKEHKLHLSDFSFFESIHQSGTKEKTIYHFIFNVYF